MERFFFLLLSFFHLLCIFIEFLFSHLAERLSVTNYSGCIKEVQRVLGVNQYYLYMAEVLDIDSYCLQICMHALFSS